MSRRAVILAGGKGTRLRPYTIVLPKPLMPVGEYPILEVVVRQLIEQGFDHITMAVNHQAELIQAFFGDGKRWNTRIDYSIESMPLSTMGPLKLIKDLPENFLVMNGDILTDLNFGQFLDQHVNQKQLFTISSHEREQISDYGVLEMSSTDVLTGFREKPGVKYNVSMGVYAVNRKVLDHIPDNISFGFDKLMLSLLGHKMEVAVKKHTGYWLDIGRPDDYEKAIEAYNQNKGLFLK